eukprot:Rhum_TRINITY_DN15260_c1_g1::Rhum_TRINITY_DN15260_c1_g1_i11::g.146365::m.146365
MLQALLGEVAELKQQRSITPRTVGSVGDSSELGAALEEAQRERGELDRLHEPGTGGVETSSVPAASAEAPAWATALQANIAARLQEIEALSGADGGSADAVAAVVGQLKDELVAKLEEGRAADADTLRACVESLQGGADVRAELRALSEKVDDAVRMAGPLHGGAYSEADKQGSFVSMVTATEGRAADTEPLWAAKLRDYVEAKLALAPLSSPPPAAGAVAAAGAAHVVSEVASSEGGRSSRGTDRQELADAEEEAARERAALHAIVRGGGANADNDGDADEGGVYGYGYGGCDMPDDEATLALEAAREEARLAVEGLRRLAAESADAAGGGGSDVPPREEALQRAADEAAAGRFIEAPRVVRGEAPESAPALAAAAADLKGEILRALSSSHEEERECTRAMLAKMLETGGDGVAQQLRVLTEEVGDLKLAAAAAAATAATTPESAATAAAAPVQPWDDEGATAAAGRLLEKLTEDAAVLGEHAGPAVSGEHLAAVTSELAELRRLVSLQAYAHGTADERESTCGAVSDLTAPSLSASSTGRPSLSLARGEASREREELHRLGSVLSPCPSGHELPQPAAAASVSPPPRAANLDEATSPHELRALHQRLALLAERMDTLVGQTQHSLAVSAAEQDTFRADALAHLQRNAELVAQVRATDGAAQARGEEGYAQDDAQVQVEADDAAVSAAVEEAQAERANLAALHAAPSPLAEEAAPSTEEVSTAEAFRERGGTGAAGDTEPAWACRLREGFEAKVQSVQESKEEPKVAKVEEMLQALLGEVAELKQQRSITPRTVG